MVMYLSEAGYKHVSVHLMDLIHPKYKQNYIKQDHMEDPAYPIHNLHKNCKQCIKIKARWDTKVKKRDIMLFVTKYGVIDYTSIVRRLYKRGEGLLVWYRFGFVTITFGGCLLLCAILMQNERGSGPERTAYSLCLTSCIKTFKRFSKLKPSISTRI